MRLLYVFPIKKSSHFLLLFAAEIGGYIAYVVIKLFLINLLTLWSIEGATRGYMKINGHFLKWNLILKIHLLFVLLNQYKY